MDQDKYTAMTAERAFNAIVQDLEIAINCTPTGPARERLTEINMDVIRLRAGDYTPRPSEALPSPTYPEDQKPTMPMSVMGHFFDLPLAEYYHQERAILYSVYWAIRMIRGGCALEDFRRWGQLVSQKMEIPVHAGEAPSDNWQSLVWSAGTNAAAS